MPIHEEDGSYWAEVKELPGCFASGRDLEELKDAVLEAIELYLADDDEAEPKKRLATARVDDARPRFSVGFSARAKSAPLSA